MTEPAAIGYRDEETVISSWRQTAVALLLRVDRAVVAMGPIRATATLVSVTVLGGEFLHFVMRAAGHPLFARTTLLSTIAVTLVVATPAVYYSQALIRRLVHSRRALRALTDKLATALDAAEAANETKLRFFANANHELRTPLNAILGFSEIMASEAFGPMENTRYRDYVRDIHRSAEHLLALVNDILDLTRTETRDRPLSEDADCDLAAVFAETLGMVQPAADREKVRLQSVIAPEAVALRANERMLMQILLNLLSNAVKFAPGGRVELSARLETGGALMIAAADNGIGMSAAEIAIALTPFGQVDNTLTRKHIGTGLGLPLARAMMEMHGGNLTIESELDRGTVVSLRFPATRVTATAPAEAGAAKPEPVPVR
ncbi:MAG: sensor histidine kinase [Stellaceae bacterium]